MVKQHSFFIKDTSLSQSEKTQLRQQMICDSVAQEQAHFSELFHTNLPLTEVAQKNCENVIGSVEIPVGVAGPVSANVLFYSATEKIIQEQKKYSFVIPLATTEGALVASIQRGVKLLNEASTSVVVKKVGMSRSVVFECDSIKNTLKFESYFAQNHTKFAQLCEETSSHIAFLSYESFMRDKLLYVRFVFDTDEAMGMNMVTIALSHAWEQFKEQLPDDVSVSLLTVSGNVCTDKKDSMINRLFGRGYIVTVESKIPSKLVLKHLKVDPKELVKIHLVKNVIGSNVAGSFAQNMHVANALGAFYLATGQDIAHVVAGSEASTHFEYLEKTDELYVAVTLPNVSVGSIGGGTWLPKQTQARRLLVSSQQTKATTVKTVNVKNAKATTAKELAAAAGLAALGGEISGLAALTTHTLAQAHERLGRLHKK